MPIVNLRSTPNHGRCGAASGRATPRTSKGVGLDARPSGVMGAPRAVSNGASRDTAPLHVLSQITNVVSTSRARALMGGGAHSWGYGAVPVRRGGSPSSGAVVWGTGRLRAKTRDGRRAMRGGVSIWDGVLRLAVVVSAGYNVIRVERAVFRRPSRTCGATFHVSYVSLDGVAYRLRHSIFHQSVDKNRFGCFKVPQIALKSLRRRRFCGVFDGVDVGNGGYCLVRHFIAAWGCVLGGALDNGGATRSPVILRGCAVGESVVVVVVPLVFISAERGGIRTVTSRVSSVCFLVFTSLNTVDVFLRVVSATCVLAVYVQRPPALPAVIRAVLKVGGFMIAGFVKGRTFIAIRYWVPKGSSCATGRVSLV